MGKLSGKIALVTGGSSGIGLATAELFIAEGAFVFITGRRRLELENAARALGDHAEAVVGDIAKLGDLDNLFERIKERTGRLDILFANAGVGEIVALGDITEAHFDKTFGVNVKGTVFTVQKGLPLMPAGAAIVLSSSMVSIMGYPSFSVYAATKAALRSFARSWIVDLKGRNIRVNAISPGVTPTPGYDTLGLTKEQVRDFIESQVASIPMGRSGTVEEIAKAVLFLVSDDSSYVNGIELFVDGGAAQI